MTDSKTPRLLLELAGVLLAFTAGYLVAPAPSSESRNLCEMGPQFCEPCGGAGQAPCPAGDAGWLCCSRSSGVCVVADASCTGADNVLGYCDNYTLDGDVATCHDGEDAPATGALALR